MVSRGVEASNVLCTKCIPTDTKSALQFPVTFGLSVRFCFSCTGSAQPR